MTAPLAGVRVVDLTMVWAGPFGTRMLGDYGAEVIKVEAPNLWDQLRGLGMIPRTDPRFYNKSAYFNHNNRSKLGLALNLRDPRGREVLLDLIKVSDVIVENYRSDVMDNLGLDVETVRSTNPNIIYISMPGYGKTGPEKDYVAYGTNVEQVAGIVALSGYEGDEPMKTGFSYGDPMAGTALVGAVALALRKRRLEGHGSYMELAQRENLSMFVGEYMVDYSMNGVQRQPIGNRHPHHAPHGVYRCAGLDSWIAIGVETDEQFRALCTTIGAPELADDERYATQQSRKAHETDLDEVISAWTANWGHYEAMHILQRAGIPAGAALTIPELMADPQLRTRRAWAPQVHPDAGTWEMETPPWYLSRTPGHAKLPAPGFGQHNHYVFKDVLNMSDEAINELYEAGITADTPDITLHQ